MEKSNKETAGPGARKGPRSSYFDSTNMMKEEITTVSERRAVWLFPNVNHCVKLKIPFGQNTHYPAGVSGSTTIYWTCQFHPSTSRTIKAIKRFNLLSFLAFLHLCWSPSSLCMLSNDWNVSRRLGQCYENTRNSQCRAVHRHVVFSSYFTHRNKVLLWLYILDSFA